MKKIALSFGILVIMTAWLCVSSSEEFTVSPVDGNALVNAKGLVTITKPGEYALKGDYTGQIIIDVPKKSTVTLRFDGARITNPAGPAIRALRMGTVELSLTENTENAISDGFDYLTDSDKADAAIYVKGDVVISGTGALTVAGNARHGIVAKRGLTINDGNISISAAKDGIHAKEIAEINGGNIDIASVHEGMESEIVSINGGTLKVLSGEDGINAKHSMAFTGGVTEINASGDGVDCNGRIYLDGGLLFISGPTSGLDSAVDPDDGIVVTGGGLMAFCVGEQEYSPELTGAVSIAFDRVEGGKNVKLTDANGKTLLEYAPEKPWDTVILSVQAAKHGDKRELYIDGELAHRFDG